jgi:hypothetical protein
MRKEKGNKVHVGLKKKKPLFGYAPEWCACDLFLVVGM